MNIPLEVSYRNVLKTDAIETLIREKVRKLEQVCDHISSCRVAIEKPQTHQQLGNPYRVRLDITVPPGHEIVIKREPGDNPMHEPLAAVIRAAFASARRQLQELTRRQRMDVKTHPEQENAAIVARLFPEADYGFLETLDGRQIFFHRHSVLNNDFDRLKPGTGVRFSEEIGDKGPQASTVQIVDKPGSRLSADQESGSEPLIAEIRSASARRQR